MPCPTRFSLRAGVRSLPWCLALAGALALGGAAARADEPTLLRVNTFPNAKALPFHAGIAQGIFAKRGIALELSFTENSASQRQGLAAGRFDMVHAAVDNAVAMAEARKDVVILTGGDSGMNEFFVQAYIGSLAELRGRTLAVDAPNTAYAIQAKKILLKEGLKEGADYKVVPVGRGELRLKAMAENKDYAAAILNLPFTIQAEQLGMKSLGNTVDMLGPYQAGGAFALRSWVGANGGLLERYLAGYLESLRWVRGPENRAACVELLMDRLKIPAMSPSAATRCSSTPASASRPTPPSTWRDSATCSRCARRSRAANRRRPSAISTSATTSGR